jgi:hypothetical protein
VKSIKNKTFYLIISLVAIILFLFIVLKFPNTGEAIAGINSEFDIVQDGNDLVVKFTSNTEEINGVSLSLSSTSFPLCEATLTPISWGFSGSECLDNTLTFGAASATDFRDGEVELLRISLETIPDTITLNVADLYIYDGMVKLFDGESGDIVITQPDSPGSSSSSSSSSSGSSSSGSSSSSSGGTPPVVVYAPLATAPVASSDGSSLTCEVSWQCSEWSECNEEKNVRDCFDLMQCNSTELLNGIVYEVVLQGDDKPAEEKRCDEIIDDGYSSPKKQIPSVYNSIKNNLLSSILGSLVVIGAGIGVFFGFRKKKRKQRKR